MQKIEAGDQNSSLNNLDNSSAVLDSKQKFLDSIQVVTFSLVCKFELIQMFEFVGAWHRSVC